jgi:hypothetical protein
MAADVHPASRARHVPRAVALLLGSARSAQTGAHRRRRRGHRFLVASACDDAAAGPRRGWSQPDRPWTPLWDIIASYQAMRLPSRVDSGATTSLLVRASRCTCAATSRAVHGVEDRPSWPPWRRVSSLRREGTPLNTDDKRIGPAQKLARCGRLAEIRRSRFSGPLRDTVSPDGL